MDFMFFAFAVDLIVYASLGLAVAHFGRRFLPEPWNDRRFTVTIFVVAGALITMATFQHWLIYPG